MVSVMQIQAPWEFNSWGASIQTFWQLSQRFSCKGHAASKNCQTFSLIQTFESKFLVSLSCCVLCSCILSDVNRVPGRPADYAERCFPA